MEVRIRKYNEGTQKYEDFCTITNVSSVNQCDKSHCVTWRDEDGCLVLKYFDISKYQLSIWSN